MLSISQLNRASIELLVSKALYQSSEESIMACRGPRPNKVIGSMFIEGSLRTRVGFEAAAASLGLPVVQIQGPKYTTSMGEPETLLDTARCVGESCDLILLRHPDEDAPSTFAEATDATVVNCGNGHDEHPTQALIDMLALRAIHGGIDGLRVAIVGDLANMRTAHSLLLALAHFEDISVRAIGPANLTMPERYRLPFILAGNRFEATTEPDFAGVDVVYVAGLPSTPGNGVRHDDQVLYRISGKVAAGLDTSTTIFCPLPRVDEIAPEVDVMPQAAYFDQHRLGKRMRVRILQWLLAERGHVSTDSLLGGPC